MGLDGEKVLSPKGDRKIRCQSIRLTPFVALKEAYPPDSPSSPARKPVYPKQQIDKSVRRISFAEINLSTTYGS